MDDFCKGKSLLESGLSNKSEQKGIVFLAFPSQCQSPTESSEFEKSDGRKHDYASAVKLCLSENVLEVFVQGHRPMLAFDSCNGRNKTTSASFVTNEAVIWRKNGVTKNFIPAIMREKRFLKGQIKVQIITEIDGHDLFEPSGAHVSDLSGLCRFENSCQVKIATAINLGSCSYFETSGRSISNSNSRQNLNCPAKVPILKIPLALAVVAKANTNQVELVYGTSYSKRKAVTFYCNHRQVDWWVSGISKQIISSNYKLCKVINNTAKLERSPLIYISRACVNNCPKLLAVERKHLKVYDPELSSVIDDKPEKSYELCDLTWNFGTCETNKGVDHFDWSVLVTTDDEEMLIEFENSQEFNHFLLALETTKSLLIPEVDNMKRTELKLSSSCQSFQVQRSATNGSCSNSYSTTLPTIHFETENSASRCLIKSTENNGDIDKKKLHKEKKFKFFAVLSRLKGKN